MDDELLNLTRVPTEIAKIVDGPAPGYRVLHTAIVDGRIPGEWINGRWYVKRSTLPEIAKLVRPRMKIAV